MTHEQPPGAREPIRSAESLARDTFQQTGRPNTERFFCQDDRKKSDVEKRKLYWATHCENCRKESALLSSGLCSACALALIPDHEKPGEIGPKEMGKYRLGRRAPTRTEGKGG